MLTSAEVNLDFGHDEDLYNGLKTSLSSGDQDRPLVDLSDGNRARTCAQVNGMSRPDRLSTRDYFLLGSGQKVKEGPTFDWSGFFVFQPM